MSNTSKKFPTSGAKWTAQSGQKIDVIIVYMDGIPCYQYDHDYICENCGAKLDIAYTNMRCPICGYDNSDLIPKPKGV